MHSGHSRLQRNPTHSEFSDQIFAANTFVNVQLLCENISSTHVRLKFQFNVYASKRFWILLKFPENFTRMKIFQFSIKIYFSGLCNFD